MINSKEVIDKILIKYNTGVCVLKEGRLLYPIKDSIVGSVGVKEYNSIRKIIPGVKEGVWCKSTINASKTRKIIIGTNNPNINNLQLYNNKDMYLIYENISEGIKLNEYKYIIVFNIDDDLECEIQIYPPTTSEPYVEIEKIMIKDISHISYKETLETNIKPNITGLGWF